LLLKYLSHPIAAPYSYTAKRSEIDGSFNAGQLEQEFRRAMMQANPKKSLALSNVETYEKKNEELSKKLQELSTNPTVLAGSEACWAIVQRGLENQGLRGKELQSTMQYMRAQVQRTPEAVRDRSALAESEFQYDGETEEYVSEEYNKGKSFRGVTNFFRGTNPYHEYQQQLFTPQNLGLGMNDNPYERRFRLPQLIDAYFRVKYLMSLPASNPLHLPESAQLVTFMRRLHQAIMDRSQESFNYASGMNNAELQQLRAAGMEVDAKTLPNMSMTDRMQTVHSFLHNGQPYFDKNKALIERIAGRAYRPIAKRKENHDIWMSRLRSPWATTRTAVGYTSGVVRSTTDRVIVRPAKAVWKNKGSIGAGAAIGTLILPGIGTIIGGAIGPWAKKTFFKEDK
jgi:hypothetical protein